MLLQSQFHVSTLSLDAVPRGIAGTLRLNQLIQPKRVARTDLTARTVPYDVLRRQKKQRVVPFFQSQRMMIQIHGRKGNR